LCTISLMPCHRIGGLLSRQAAARPVALEGRWLDEGPDACWVAADPLSVLEGSGEAFAELPSWLKRHTEQYPEGAAIGYLCYELARHLEHLPLTPCPSLPDLSFAYYPRLERLAPQANDAREAEGFRHVEAGFDFDAYRRAMEKVRSYIAAGDIYQANLTIPFSAELGETDPVDIYLRLRSNQAPFGAFLKTPQRTILSNSPERFFRVTGNRLLASPIKGTIERAAQEDSRSVAALLASEKDRAENLMIVDLLRNDLGRICDFASIRTRLWETEVLPHLIHLVSHVEGTLQPGTSVVEIILALFPCGSITGAPKIRAIELLAELEPAPRGVSMGAIGIIRRAAADRCRMDFNVAIRTIVIESGKASFNVGGGIVYDSNALSEYREVMLKAQPLFEALGAVAPPWCCHSMSSLAPSGGS